MYPLRETNQREAAFGVPVGRAFVLASGRDGMSGASSRWFPAGA